MSGSEERWRRWWWVIWAALVVAQDAHSSQLTGTPPHSQSWGQTPSSTQPRRHHTPSMTSSPSRRPWWGDLNIRRQNNLQSAASSQPHTSSRQDSPLPPPPPPPQTNQAVQHRPLRHQTHRRDSWYQRYHGNGNSEYPRRQENLQQTLPRRQNIASQRRGSDWRQSPPPLQENNIPSQQQQQQQRHASNRWHEKTHRSPRIPARHRRPNIVLLMTDDQDVELGSLNYMPYLMNQMRERGAYFPNAYCSTPICCPSRSSMLTGLYIHNHEVYTNNHNCSSYHWQQTHEQRTFATYLKDAGYRTGYFGKYLNKYNGSHIPAGWQEWAGLIKNSRYYNYTVMRNGNFVKYGDQYPKDYYPHVITNEGLQFLRKNRALNQPMMLVLSYPAPHGPEDSAPEHAHRFFNATDHNTMSYNYAPNPDKQWLLQFTGRMHDIEVKFTDVLMTKRLQTLQTVDESVAKVVSTLEALGELDNTYIFYTSDHGYHLGQFGLVKGKSMPFEFDIKVPFVVRGPGIKPGVQINNIALNIDLAPTFLDIAGVRPPAHMDGRSLLPILTSTWNSSQDSVKWRNSFLVESSGRHREEDALELREARRQQRAQGLSGSGIKGGLYTSKRERLEIICQNDEYQSPCLPGQKWECVRDDFRWRLHKCRRRRERGPRVRWRQRNCVCEPDLGMGYMVRLDSAERRKQRTFLKKHLTQDLRSYGAKFIKVFSDVDSRELVEQSLAARGSLSTPHRPHRTHARQRRDTGEEQLGDRESEGDFSHYGGETGSSDVVDAFVKDEEIRDLDVAIDTLSDELESLENVSNIAATSESIGNTSTSAPESHAGPRHGCRVTGSTVGCTDDVYRDPQAWRLSKVAIDKQIRRLRHQLIVMKNIRKHLRDSRPNSAGGLDDYGDYEEAEEAGSGDYELDLRGPGNNTTFTTTTHFNSNASGHHREVEGSLVIPSSLNVDPPFVTDPSDSIGGEEEEEEEEESMVNHSDATLQEVENDGIIVFGTDYDVGQDAGSSQETHLEGGAEVGRAGQAPAAGGGGVRRVGGRVGSPSRAGSNKFHVYPMRASPVHHQASPTVLENETSARSHCWCNPSFRLEYKQAERNRKRQERLKLRLERQRVKQQRREMKERKKLRKIKNNLAQCNYTMLNCYTHDNNHWRTPPLWHDGKFCFCMNAVNNTYWCVRTINQTHNFLYCEFITGLVTYYDLNIDPYQLRNVAFTLSNKRLAELHHRLEGLRTCSGASHCDDLPLPPPAPAPTPTAAPAPAPVHQSSANRRPALGLPIKPKVELSNRVEVLGPPRKAKDREERRRLRKERQRHREERRRHRKEQKKWKRHQLQGPQRRQVLQSMGSDQRIVRLPRKSRTQERQREKERRREKRRERKRRKKSKRVRIS